MVVSNDSIKVRNVISKKYRFFYKDMSKIMESFLEDTAKLNTTVKGPLFYSINNVPKDEFLNIEFFMPVKEDYIEVQDDMNFHSYFSIENMISICVCSNFEKNIEIAYRILLDYIDDNNLVQTTPIFHVVSGDESLQYIIIKIGIMEKSVLDADKISNAKMFK